MDPDKALEILRNLARESLKSEGDERALAQQILALDGWINQHGFLPAAWLGYGATTLKRTVEHDTAEWKSVVWSAAGCLMTIRVYWRNDLDVMDAPRISSGETFVTRSPEEARILSTLLRAAASTASQWLADPPWNRKIG